MRRRDSATHLDHPMGMDLWEGRGVTMAAVAISQSPVSESIVDKYYEVLHRFTFIDLHHTESIASTESILHPPRDRIVLGIPTASNSSLHDIDPSFPSLAQLSDQNDQPTCVR